MKSSDIRALHGCEHCEYTPWTIYKLYSELPCILLILVLLGQCAREKSLLCDFHGMRYALQGKKCK